MKKIATFIIKYRYIFAIAFILFAIASIFGMSFVKQNYDMTKYLPEATDTKKGLAIMKDEFGLSNNILVMVSVGESETSKIKKKLSAVNGVEMVTLDSYKEGKALFLVTLKGDEYSDETKETIDRIKETLTDEEYTLSGSAVSSMKLAKTLKTEIPMILIIALVIIFLVLLLTSRSWLEPVVFGIVLLVSVLINMGTNIIFGEISYITFAVAAILQIALAMDYSIILLHGFTERKDRGMNDRDALIESLAYNMRPISSSGLTTIAGLIALLFMSFSIGFDIGIVLAKGILISLMTVVLFMPSLIILFSKPIEKTKHKTIPLGGAKIAKLSLSMRKVLPIVMIVVIVGSYILQLGNVYSFSGWDTSEEAKIVEKEFGNVNQAVLIVDNSFADDKETQSRFIDSISALKEGDKYAFKSVNSWTNMQISSQMLADLDLGIEQFKPYVSSLLGENPKIKDIQKLWSDSKGNVFDIEVSKAFIALSLEKDESDFMVGLAYSTLKDPETGKVTIDGVTKALVNMKDSPLLDGLVTDEAKEIAAIMQNNKQLVGDGFNELLTPIIASLSEKFGAETSVYDISLDINEIFSKICNIFFAKNTLDVFEFYRSWQSANEKFCDLEITENIVQNLVNLANGADSEQIYKEFKTFVKDDKATLDKFLEFISLNKDDENFKNLLGEQIIAACALANVFKDFIEPFIDGAISPLLNSVRSSFVGKSHARIVLLMNLPKDSKATFRVIDEVKKRADECFGEDNYLAGESMTVKDISDAFSDDLLKINTVTVLSIFIIIALLFRSLIIPFILVLIIQGAIWITMAINAVFNVPIFFMSYIICVCIQMGATIDYGILIASSYRRNRVTMNKRDSVIAALRSAMPTILTSGLILIAAGFIIGIVSSIMPIYSIGRLLGLGTIVSILLILFLLPAILYLLDKPIEALTWDGLKPLKIQNESEANLDAAGREKTNDSELTLQNEKSDQGDFNQSDSISNSDDEK